MQTYLVGGAVRDELLGREPRERDWVVVGATPEDLEAAGYRRVGQSFPVFLHPETREEYALARRERKSGHGYHGFELDFGPEVTLEEDLGRRDLTINAIARADDGTVIDPYGGREDLRDGILRHVSPAFVEDPLRVLRVARFAARFAPLGFRVAAETRDLMRRIVESGELAWLAPERVWQEIERALGEPAPGRFLDELAACSALAEILPPLASMAATPETPARRALDAAVTGDLAPQERFAALCHPLEPGTELARLHEQLPLPRAWQELAELVAAWWPQLIEPADGNTAWSALRGCDALRRPERFERVLAVAAAVAAGRGAGASDGAATLRAALDAASAIEGGALAREGWRGAELGAELERRRRAAVQALFTDAPSGPGAGGTARG